MLPPSSSVLFRPFSAHRRCVVIGVALYALTSPPLFLCSMPSITLTGIPSDVWLCMLPFCSYTNLLHLSHIHRHLHSLSRQRTWSDSIRRSHLQPHLTATQQSIIADKGWSAQQLMEYVMPALARVETHLLHHHLIPPLHVTLLLQALLTADFSSVSSSSSSSSGAASLSHHHSLAHTGSYPNMQSYFLHYHRHPSDGPLSSPTSLHSLSLPSVCLWLSNPFAVPSWVHRFSMRKRTAEAQDEVRDLVAQMDGRVVWIGSAQLRTTAVHATQAAADTPTMPFAFGYWLGRIEEPRERHVSVCMSSSSIDECQQRMHDPAIDWSTLPIVVYRIHASSVEHVSHASYQSLRLFPSLADVLRLALPAEALSASTAALVDEALGERSGDDVGQHGQTLLLQQRRPVEDGQLECKHVTIASAADGLLHSSRPRRRWVA